MIVVFSKETVEIVVEVVVEGGGLPEIEILFSFCELGIKDKYFLPFFTSFDKGLALNTV